MSAEADLSSGDLARATGNTVRTIRFYEEQRLLKPAVVSGGGRRRYTGDDLEKLRFILDLRELGLSLCEIRSVLELRAGCHTAGEPAERFQQALRDHIAQAQRRLERLRRVKRELTQALASIQQRLSGELLATNCTCSVAGVGDMPGIVEALTRDEGRPHQAPGETPGSAKA